MKVYTLLIRDRHSDPTVRIFADKDKAIETAKALAHEYDRFGSYEEHEIAGWIFHASYSCEGDYVTVNEAEVEE